MPVKLFAFVYFQSFLDMSASTILLLNSLTIRDAYSLYNDGLVGTIECILWNSKFLMWGLFFSSTINIVAVTIERLVTISK